MRKRPLPTPRKKTPAAVRDTDASTFAVILLDLIARVPGALGAVLVDAEGEAVDYAGRLDAFDLKLAAAHWQIVLTDLRAKAAAHTSGTPRSLVVRGEKRSFIVHELPEGYTLVLVLSRRAGFTQATRAFAVCERALVAEAGWRLPARVPAWFGLDVESTRAGRPARISFGTRRQGIEVLGRIASRASGDVGWRVRLENGAEVTLIREPGHHWYAEEPPEKLFPPRPRSSTTRPSPRS